MYYFLFTLENLRNLGDKIVEIASTQDDEHLEIMGLDIVEHLIFADDLFDNALLEIVVDKLRCNPFDRQFTGWIDLCQHHFIKLTQRLSEFTIEIARTSIEVWLEDGSNALVLVKLTDALCALVDFLGMVGIVAEEN